MVTVVDHTGYGFSKKSLSSLKRDISILLKSLEEKYRRPSGEVNIALLSEKGIQDLHKRYLRKNRPTDVLTFPSSDTPIPAGDIALCPYRILLYAFRDRRLPVSWFYHTLLHGLLHLYGLDHDYGSESLQRVYRLQESIIKKNHLYEESIYDIFEKIILFTGTTR